MSSASDLSSWGDLSRSEGSSLSLEARRRDWDWEYRFGVPSVHRPCVMPRGQRRPPGASAGKEVSPGVHGTQGEGQDLAREIEEEPPMKYEENQEVAS